MAAETTSRHGMTVRDLASTVAFARGSADPLDWYSTGTSVCDRFSSRAVDRLTGGAAEEPPPPGLSARLAAAIRFLAGAYARMWSARPGARALGRIAAGAPVAVVRTWAGTGAFESGGFRDPYFGPLAGTLRSRGHEVITVVGALASHHDVYRAAAAAGVVPEHALLRWADPVRAAWAALARRPRARGPAVFGGRDISPDLQVAIDEEHERGQVFANRLQSLIARRLCERFDIRLAVLTHEGYAWERQFVLGMREAAQDAWVAGYQHAPISEGVTSLVAAPDGLAGLPDRVVTMGAVTAGMLIARGYPAAMVLPGPSLRMPRPVAGGALARSLDGPVLVALGEVGRAVRLTRVIRELVSARPGTRVVLRHHPLAPRARFEALLDFDPVGFGLEFSAGGPVAEDLSGCSAVVYDASAVAFEAVAAGVPAVHVRLGDPLSLDPLAGLDALHAEAADAAGVTAALDGFRALPDDVYRRQVEEARAFVDAYLGEVSDETLAAFLPRGEDAA